jgi:peptidoglycan-associated lipoprotein
MRKKWMWIAIGLILPAAFLMAGCAKEAVQSQTEAVQATPTSAQADTNTTPSAFRQQTEDQAGRGAFEAAAAAFVGEKVYFDFDSSLLTPQARQMLNIKADFLSAHRDVAVMIEGHCDERGTAAYNLALGERRAEAVRNYLINLGTSAERLTIISYGEERPVAHGKDETAWAKNRRAQFVIN